MVALAPASPMLSLLLVAFIVVLTGIYFEIYRVVVSSIMKIFCVLLIIINFLAAMTSHDLETFLIS